MAARRRLLDAGHRLEQAQVGTQQVQLARELVEPWHAGVLLAVQRVAEARDALAGPAPGLHRRGRDLLERAAGGPAGDGVGEGVGEEGRRVARGTEVDAPG